MYVRMYVRGLDKKIFFYFLFLNSDIIVTKMYYIKKFSKEDRLRRAFPT